MGGSSASAHLIPYPSPTQLFLSVRLCLPAMPAHAGQAWHAWQTGESQRSNPRRRSWIATSFHCGFIPLQGLYTLSLFLQKSWQGLAKILLYRSCSGCHYFCKIAGNLLLKSTGLSHPCFLTRKDVQHKSPLSPSLRAHVRSEHLELRKRLPAILTLGRIATT